jgi:hypothetical protein
MQVAEAKTLGGGAVTGLVTQGSLLLASDFLASVTLLRLESQRVTKPGSPPTTVTSLVPLSADHNPVFAQSAALLGDARALVSVHPHGLALMRRDSVGEAEGRRRAAARAEEQGAHAGRRGAAG